MGEGEPVPVTKTGNMLLAIVSFILLLAFWLIIKHIIRFFYF